jgi:integrase
VQVTKRGFGTAHDASVARRSLLENGAAVSRSVHLTVDELLDMYLDGVDADSSLAAKTRFDYRSAAAAWVRPWLGKHKVKDVTPDVIVKWQRRLSEGGGAKDGKPLSPNSIRLARAPLAAAFRMAVKHGLVSVSPMVAAPRPKQRRRIPQHWSPEQARSFLAAMEGERDYALWAFLLGSGLRIGELVWLKWFNVNLNERQVRVVEFASTLGYDLISSNGKSRDAVRTIDFDDGLVRLLRSVAAAQAAERLSTVAYEVSDFVFTRPAGGSFHPQTLSKRLARVSTRLGLPRLTAHGLRHTSAMLMLANSVPPKVAAERLGHADPTLFMNLYSHVTPTMQRDAATAIGAALFG